jgi:trimeric autotransporter adhesin
VPRRGRAAVLLLAVVSAATAFVLPGHPAEAVASPTPTSSWVANGDVHAVLEAGGRTYLGGDFDQVGPNTGFGVQLDAATGALPSSFVKVDGHVYVTVPDGSGGWYIGGDFVHVTTDADGTQSKHNGARILANGRIGGWNPNTDLPIRAIVPDPSGTRIYVGGEFTTARGVPVNGLLVTSTTGVQSPSPFPTTAIGQRVDSLALSPNGSRLYVGGTFATIGGVSRSGLAAIDTATGTVDPTWNPAPDTAAATGTTPAKTVAALATAGDGRVFVGGSFTQVGTTAVTGLAVVSPAGSGALDAAWAVGADGPVESLLMTPDRLRLFIGGGFATLGGLPRSHLAALATTGSGSVDGTFNPGADGDVLGFSLSADGMRLYTAGAFSNIGGANRRFLAALNASSGTVDTTFDARAASTVHAVSTQPAGAQVFAGGEFTSVNGVTRLNVAALDGNGVLDQNFVADTDGEVDAFATDAGKLYLGGTFLHVNGTSEVRLARLNAVTGAVDTSFRASPSAAVNALALSSNRLFIGGAFSSVSTVVRNGLASVNTAAGLVEDWNPNVDNYVATLAISPDQTTVYVAGDFTKVGGLNRSKAAAVDVTTGLATSWKPAPAALVVQLAVSGDGTKIFLAERGSFKDGNRLQAFNTAGAGSLAWEHRADGDFQAVAVSSALVYAGGHFGTVDGQAHLHLAAFDPASGAIQAWAPYVAGGFGHGVFDIEVSSSAVTVGGDFERSGDSTVTVVAQGVVRFGNAGDPPPTTTTLPPGVTPTTTATTAPPTTQPPATQPPTTQPPGNGNGGPPVGSAGVKVGYWMVGSDGAVYNFGDAGAYGGAIPAAGSSAVDLEPTPSGNGYWVVTDKGAVTTRGDAASFGSPAAAGLAKGEVVTSLSATPTGMGYWIFTNKGRVINFGDATFYGDMSKVTLNGPVLDSIPTTSGKGYYMVASDGGIFAFGDAKFYGSMGGKKLNAPVQSLVPDGDGTGYWLVASDGGIFAFQADFKGSMGGTKLNKPVTGMVRFADGYLMVGEDGGIFDFSTKPFLGSLGANPPAHPIVSVAALG